MTPPPLTPNDAAPLPRGLARHGGTDQMAQSNKQREYYQRLADDIIERIKDGTAPWQKPWRPGERRLPENMASGRSYTAGNSLYLATAADRRGYADNRWATYGQIQALAGHARKGESGEQVVFFARDRRVVQRDQAGKPKRGADGKSIYQTHRLKHPVAHVHRLQRGTDRRAGARPGQHPPPHLAPPPHCRSRSRPGRNPH